MYLAGVVVAALAVVAASWLGDQRRPARISDYNRGTNGIWLGHTWVEDPHTDAEIADLADRLRRAQITDVFAHVGPLTETGRIAPDRYPEAATFVRRLKAAYGGPIRVFAWVGQIEARAGGTLDIGSAEVRRAIVEAATEFPAALGFDGIHYDIEPIADGDQRFLALLDETRANPAAGTLSAAAGKWAPDGPIGALGKRLAPGSALWTSEYYEEVARRLDQVVPMLYDTGARPGQVYERVVAVELGGILRATRSTGASILAGVPTYDDRTEGHDPASENLEWALPGVATAAAAAGNPGRFAGVALYAHWQTSDDEWATFDRLWVGSGNDGDRPPPTSN